MGQSVNVTTQFLASFSIAQSFMSIMCRLQVVCLTCFITAILEFPFPSGNMPYAYPVIGLNDLYTSSAAVAQQSYEF